MSTVRIKDVARQAGVSPATVSRVLAGYGNVNEKTEAVVLKSIEELNYKPNIIARQLRSQKTNTINVIVPDITNPFFGEVIRGIEKVARKAGYEVYAVDVNRSKTIERNYISALTQKQVDGIISLSATSALKSIESFAGGFPIVIAGQYFEDTTLPSIGIDNAAATKEMTEYLISLGHRKIAFLSTFPNSSLFRDRVTGYLCALDENDIQIDMQRVAYAEDTSCESGYNTGKELIANTDVTAICTAGDELAVGVIKAAREMGLSVPGDLSVTGFDDMPISRFSVPELTTVHQPKEEIGIQAMEMLVDIISGKKMHASRSILPHSIIIRNSTDNPKNKGERKRC